MVNEDLLRRVMKRIERDQENWDQRNWSLIRYGANELPLVRVGGVSYRALDDSAVHCGTTFCVAGHTVLEAGDKILASRLSIGPVVSSSCLTPEGKRMTINERAQQLLGLNEDQADELFNTHAGNGDLSKYKKLLTMVTGVELD